MSTDEINVSFRPQLPDCEDLSLDKSSQRAKDMAMRRANCAVGDSRPGKRMDLHMTLSDLIHHETKSAYLAGYSQAMKDFVEAADVHGVECVTKAQQNLEKP